MKTFSNFKYPPGGYSFKDENGIEFVGESVGKVAAKLMEYRTVNNFPPGNPVADVHAYLCQKFPDMCVEDAVPIDGQAIVRKVVAKARDWVVIRQMKQPLPLVAPDLARQRSVICAACPHNLNWKILCMPCQSATSLLLDPLIAPHKPVQELKGRCCDIAGDDLSISVWLRASPIEAPVNCWRKSVPVVDVLPPTPAINL